MTGLREDPWPLRRLTRSLAAVGGIPRRRPERLTTTALALMANTGITSVLGVTFWLAGARLYNPSQLGEDAGLVAAMMLLASLSELSLHQAIPRLLPQLKNRRRLAVLAAYAATGTVALGLATAFVLLAPRVSPGFLFLGGDHLLQGVFVGAVAVWNVFALQDAALIAVRTPALVPVDNGVFGVLKIVLLIMLFAHGMRHSVLLAWLLAMVCVLAPINWLLFSRLLRAPSEAPARTAGLLPVSDRRRVVRYVSYDWLSGLLSQGCTFLLPVLVLASLGGAASAYFYSTFTIASALTALANALSTSLVVEGAHDEAGLSRLATQALMRIGTLLLPIMVLSLALAPFLLQPFGAPYSEHGTGVLRLLVAGCIPQALVIVYLGVERVRGHAARLAAVQGLAFSLVILGLKLLVPGWGLLGVGLAWVSAWAVTALVVTMALYRLLAPDVRSTTVRARKEER